MKHYEYSLWSKTPGDEIRWFWIIDEVDDTEEKTVASGIENTKEEAETEIRKYIPDLPVVPS